MPRCKRFCSARFSRSSRAFFFFHLFYSVCFSTLNCQLLRFRRLIRLEGLGRSLALITPVRFPYQLAAYNFVLVFI